MKALGSPFGRGKRGCGERKFLAYIYQTSRERSKKTEGVFLVGSRESEGKSKSPQARFLFTIFLLEKQKKKWVGSRKFVEEPQPYSRLHLPVSPQKQLTARNPGISKRKSAVFLHIVYKSFTILKKKGSIISIFKYERK